MSSKDPKATVTGRGFETQVGTSRVDTGAKGQGFGLSSGGGGDGGVRLGVDNFCCPEYIIDMRNRIIKNWNQRQNTTGVVTMFFTIQRNGEITEVQVEKPSGNAVSGSCLATGVDNDEDAGPASGRVSGATTTCAP